MGQAAPMLAFALCLCAPGGATSSRSVAQAVLAAPLLQLSLVPLAVQGIELNTEESLSQAVHSNPVDLAARMKLVHWHLKWGELRKAIGALKAGIREDPSHAFDFKEALGDVYFTWARDERAAASFLKEALELNPNSRRSILQYGMLRVWQGRRDEAEPLFQRALEQGLLADVRQRPLDALPRGRQQPWYDVDAVRGGRAVALRLEGAAREITAEYLKWASTRVQDSELDSDGIGDPHATGRWRHFWIYRPREERGVWRSACSYKTPATCRLLQALNNTGTFAVLRADFDVLEPRGRVRPSCHRTDAETLLYLPLLVPRVAPGAPTGITVGGETRPWVEGRIALFDATFEHEEAVPALPDAAPPEALGGHDYAGELEAFYAAQGMPGKAAEIRDILAKWAGREEKMMREVRKKYAKGWKGERVALRLLIRRKFLTTASADAATDEL